ncbi:MAG: hypothetical protein OEZ09_14980 [Betaproteobacteria bacterium]|nr:hypothetical protein [Betaproteobacteria bacterium]MDH5579751.1 hypothetical protein [Betaproteobacteria bacterium]
MMRRWTALLAPLLATACATLDTAPSAHLDSAAPGLRECAEWFRDLDARVDAAGVRDAQESRIPGFPYVRVSRLLASFRESAMRDEGALQALADRMQALDLAARAHESANLGGGSPLERARECGARLQAADLADPRLRVRLLERAAVPDDYSTASRVLGLYTITKWPFIAGVRDYQDSVRAAFRAERAPGAGVRVLRYGPPEAAPAPRAALATMIERASANPLGIPEPHGDALEALFAAHAPLFEIETGDVYDRPGALAWRTGEPVPVVDADAPVVYRMAAWTRYRGRALLQLVYTIWFSERPPVAPGDILAGRLDGVTWRVTLAPDGEPLVYDSMHPCGCYHLFFPTPRAVPVPAPGAAMEWMFAPQSLPRVADGARPVVRIATRTHYVEGVSLSQQAVATARYAFRAYDELRSLPRPEGGRASVFGPGHGLIAGTERAERFLFWPMGIPSAGAMRQWGHHATAFVGRRHFDDADLLEKRFVFDLP